MYTRAGISYPHTSLSAQLASIAVSYPRRSNIVVAVCWEMIADLSFWFMYPSDTFPWPVFQSNYFFSSTSNYQTDR